MKIKTLLIHIGVCLLWQPLNSYADTVDIREWLVPWTKSQPGSPYVDSGGRVWFVGELDNYIGNLSPETGEFNRYDLEKRSGPRSLVVDQNRNIWFTAAQGRITRCHRYFLSGNLVIYSPVVSHTELWNCHKWLPQPFRKNTL